MRSSPDCNEPDLSFDAVGSHVVLRHADGRQTYVAMHLADVPTGTFRAILEQAGLTEEQFRNL